MIKEEFVQAAIGEVPVDLLLKNGKLINVLSSRIVQVDVAIYKGYVVGFGDYKSKEVIDLKGKYIAPGFIEGHIHIESSMVTPERFALSVVPRGTTTVIADPHEIANVLGIDGIKYMVESAKIVPLNLFIMIPSCVPATSMETSGAVLDHKTIEILLKEEWAIGLAEMMNFPGVIYRDKEVMAKLKAANGKVIDGHAPMLRGKELSAYIGAGIRSDHETISLEEAQEKLDKGMFLMIREGSTAKNLKTLFPVITKENNWRIMVVSDDLHPEDIVEKGHLDYHISLLIKEGLDVITALKMVTINPATYFRLYDLGAVAPGYRADMVILSDLENFTPTMVIKDGEKVAENGILLKSVKPFKGEIPENSVFMGTVTPDQFRIPAKSEKARVIEMIPGQIITKQKILPIKIEGDVALPDLDKDILKVAVIERHKETGNIGLGFVKGFGLKKGAIASSVAHDSHNIVIIGTNDMDMFYAAMELASQGGGLVAIEDGAVIDVLPLPIAGLMSDKPVETLKDQLKSLHKAVREMGCSLPDPFMAMSFIALPVIPELKITDKGIVDVNKFEIVELFVKE